MRRTLTFVLFCALALPACAQRWSSAGRGGGSAGMHSGSRAGFSSHGGTAFRGGGIAIGGGVAFGHNPRVNVFVGSRPFHHPRRWSVYPYRYAPAYVYPYVSYPVYPLSYYDAYDYAAVPVQPSYPVYEYGYASGGDNYPDRVGLAEQMRQQQVGIYAQPQRNQAAAPATEPAAAPAAPEREMPPTVLVYRDGHRTEVSNYAIVGQTLWIFSEARAQKVALSLLDLDATRKANEERGVEFVVPR